MEANNFNSLNRARLWVGMFALAATLYVGGTYLAPILRADGESFGSVLHFLYSPTCHQMPERSISIGGVPQAVCARCSGLYLGGLAGLWLGLLFLAGRIRRLPPWLFFAALAPTAIDAMLPWVGLPQLDIVPRQYLASLGGGVAGIFVVLGLTEVFYPRVRNPDPESGVSIPEHPESGPTDPFSRVQIQEE